MVDFIFVVIELFSLSPTVRRYERKSVEVGVFRRGWVTLNADFRGKGASPTHQSWYHSSRVIALSYGIKISAVRHLVLSQSTRVTDGRTDIQTDRQNYDSQDRPRICSRDKNGANSEISCSIVVRDPGNNWKVESGSHTMTFINENYTSIH